MEIVANKDIFSGWEIIVWNTNIPKDKNGIVEKVHAEEDVFLKELLRIQRKYDVVKVILWNNPLMSDEEGWG